MWRVGKGGHSGQGCYKGWCKGWYKRVHFQRLPWFPRQTWSWMKTMCELSPCKRNVWIVESLTCWLSQCRHGEGSSYNLLFPSSPPLIQTYCPSSCFLAFVIIIIIIQDIIFCSWTLEYMLNNSISSREPLFSSVFALRKQLRRMKWSLSNDNFLGPHFTRDFSLWISIL